MNPEDFSPASTLLPVQSPTHCLPHEDAIPSVAVPSVDDLPAVGPTRPTQAQISDELGVSSVGHDPAPATPTAELAPAKRKAAIAGGGRGKVAAPRAKGAKLCCPSSVKEDVHRRLCEIKRALDDVCPRTFKDWERRVRANQHAEQEITLWTHIAATYRRCLAGRVLTGGQRREFFHLILACSTTPKERVMQVARFSAISREQAQEAVDFYASPRA